MRWPNLGRGDGVPGLRGQGQRVQGAGGRVDVGLGDVGRAG